MSTTASDGGRSRAPEGEQWFAMLGSIEGAEVPAELLAAHVEYLHRLMSRGELLAGGPLAGTSRRLRVYRARSIEDARDLVEADPYRIAGLLQYELQLWRLHRDTSARLLTAIGAGAGDSGGHDDH